MIVFRRYNRVAPRFYKLNFKGVVMVSAIRPIVHNDQQMWVRHTRPSATSWNSFLVIHNYRICSISCPPLEGFSKSAPVIGLTDKSEVRKHGALIKNQIVSPRFLLRILRTWNLPSILVSRTRRQIVILFVSAKLFAWVLLNYDYVSSVICF